MVLNSWLSQLDARHQSQPTGRVPSVTSSRGQGPAHEVLVPPRKPEVDVPDDRRALAPPEVAEDPDLGIIVLHLRRKGELAPWWGHVAEDHVVELVEPLDRHPAVVALRQVLVELDGVANEVDGVLNDGRGALDVELPGRLSTSLSSERLKL